jgi:glutamine cyclotransferase
MVLSLTACNNQDIENNNAGPDDRLPAPTNISFQVINQFPHDTTAFTEGLSFYNGTLFESTGSPDSPSNSGTWIAAVDLPAGKYQKKVNIGNTYFGEGIVFLKDKLYQLTYRSKKGFVYDAKTFKKLREFNYESEGWGLTTDGQNLIMSTGSSNLYYLDPDSLKFIKMLAVQDHNGYVPSINELEFINGYIYANQWLTPNILKIDTATGHVVAKMDMTKLTGDIKNRYPDAMELNGIAYDSVTKKTLITGKKWPWIYEIKW